MPERPQTGGQAAPAEGNRSLTGAVFRPEDGKPASAGGALRIRVREISDQGAAFMQGKVEIAGVNTAKLKVLKGEETMELLRRTKAGDQEARRQLIEGNLRLVLSVIQRFAGRGENADDLFQVGCVGLIKAIDNFDVSQPVKFSTYGVPIAFRS